MDLSSLLKGGFGTPFSQPNATASATAIAQQAGEFGLNALLSKYLTPAAPPAPNSGAQTANVHQVDAQTVGGGVGFFAKYQRIIMIGVGLFVTVVVVGLLVRRR